MTESKFKVGDKVRHSEFYVNRFPDDVSNGLVGEVVERGPSNLPLVEAYPFRVVHLIDGIHREGLYTPDELELIEEE